MGIIKRKKKTERNRKPFAVRVYQLVSVIHHVREKLVWGGCIECLEQLRELGAYHNTVIPCEDS